MENNNTRIKPRFNTKSKDIIKQLNDYFEKERNGNFICISSLDEIKNRNSIVKFVCTRCGCIIEKSIFNATRQDGTHHGIQCPNCDEHIESLHALVLKQIFTHYYPDTVLEDRSCINPNTNAVMATDIVNHRLKIAIEVQGQWHRFEKQKERDRIKKQYWLSKGYEFYDYEIDLVSVLEYIQLFFPDLTEIPEWVNMDYNKKINIVEAQKLLNEGCKVNQVADKMEINIHRLYDALHCNKLYYPDDYSKSSKKKVIMFDRNMNILKEYDCYRDAERDNNILHGLIASCIYYKNYFCYNYYWLPKDLYVSGDYIIPKNRTNKFYQSVIKCDLEGNKLCKYSNMYEAAKDVETIAFKIHEVVIGKRKSVKGYKFKFA